jgi:Fic family protein
MRKEDFTESAPGALVKNLQGILTFAPAPLPPPSLSLPMPMLRQLSTVDNTLGRLEGTAKALPDRRILIRSFVRREAQLSSYIENTYARYEEVAAADEEGRENVAEPIRETLNAERAISAGIQAVFDQDRPVSLQLIRQMHGILLSNVRGHGSRGRFRERQVFIGSSHDVDRARFVPPPDHMVDELMQSFAAYLPDSDDLPPAVRLALLHYQFETIHPFEDGNGRLGRILILLGLCQYKLLNVPLFNASLHFERNRQEYYDRLLRVSTHGDWTGWIGFFVEGLRVAAVESLAKLDELTTLRSRYHRRLHSARNSVLLLKLVDLLFIRPVIRVSDAASEMGVTYPPAQKSIKKLIEARILSEIKPRSMPARFIARGILEAVNAKPTRR